MKISLKWLQTYFDKPLPNAEAIGEALTFHAFEIESIEGDLVDVNVLPNRAADCLCHRGIAREISALLEVPLTSDPLREALPAWQSTDELELVIQDPKKCRRHMGALVRGVKVGPSPAWLKDALEAIGQRSINNIVDATNFVTHNMGQPLHAFDASKITRTDGKLVVGVRSALEGESITTLSGETYVLPEDTLVICEGADATPLDIAGIKGGMASAITEQTTDLLVSVANFDGPTIRRTAQTLKLWTDASLRFQNKPSAELPAYGMRDILALIQKVAGGEVVGVNDCYPSPEKPAEPVSVTLARINGLLGSSYSEADVVDAFDRLGFSYTHDKGTFTVTPYFERRDLLIPEDLVEEVGRVLGYDRIPSTPLPPMDAVDQARFRGIERIKDFLAERGYTEISTQSFAASGNVLLANPLQDDKPYLRMDLQENMREALLNASYVAPRVLGVAESVKLFEIGKAFEGVDGEYLSLRLGCAPLSGKASPSVLSEDIDALKDLVGQNLRPSLDGQTIGLSLSSVDLERLGASYEPARVRLGTYTPFSIYPFALRDVAVWTPAGTEMSEVESIILKEVGDLLARIDLFDRFEKDGRISYAFRLVFESNERTLSDEDLNPIMERVTKALNARDGFEVR